MQAAALDAPAPAPTPVRRPEDTPRILLRGLVGLRWVLFSLLTATLPLAEHLFGAHAQYLIALPAIAAVLITNASMSHRLRAGVAVTLPWIGAAVALDLVAIGVVLAASGGAANPMSALFFVHVALAASLLPARMTFALAGLSACVFAALFALPSGSCCASHAADEGFSAHLYGMLLAFILCAGLVTYFLTRVRAALDAREAEIGRLVREAGEAQRFAALGTLAAGTAHELATPLGTIAVLAGEIADAAGGSTAALHAATISAQVARCRDVITKMQAGAAAARGVAARTEASTAVERAVATWRAAHPGVLVDVRASAAPEEPRVAADDVEAALCAVLDNALHATRAAGAPTEAVGGEEALEPTGAGSARRAAGAPIIVALSVTGGAATVTVDDEGTGLAPELRGRLGEPFVTTKEPGAGMGLGLYLVRRLLEDAGGSLDVEDRVPRGTRVTLCLGAPRSRREVASAAAAIGPVGA